MDYLILNNYVCRICLEHRIMLNWNEEMFDEICGMTYKDCYYKYTELPQNDSDPFPTSICEECANELKGSYLLFKKALESFQILELSFKAADERHEEVCDSESTIQIGTQSLNRSMSIDISEASSTTKDNTLTYIEEELYLANMYDSEFSEKTDAANNSEDLTMSGDNEIKLAYFKDIKNYDPSCGKSLSQEDSKKFDAAVSKISKNKSESCAEILFEQKDGGDCKVKTSLRTTNSNTRKRKGKESMICAYCSLTVKGIDGLRRHEETHSEYRERTEICPQCGIKLYTKLTLQNHMKIHDENREKKHKCEFCEKSFFNRGALNVHRRIHLGLMVPCRICSKEFYRQVDLDIHMLRHSVAPPKKRVKPIKYTVQCQYCNKNILTDKWKEHKAAHLNEPQVKCKICGKDFFSRARCAEHIKRLHLKKKGYEEFIHYYVVNTRTSLLMLQQQEIVKPLTE